MRVALAGLLVIAAIAVGQPSGLGDLRPASSRTVDRGPCDEERWMRITPESWSERKVKGLIRCAVRRWPVPGGAAKAIAVAECESSLWPWAVGGDSYGLFQHKDDYWFGRVDRYLRRRWLNRHQWERLQERITGAFIARANVLVSIRMAHAGGWGPWSCG